MKTTTKRIKRELRPWNVKPGDQVRFFDKHMVYHVATDVTSVVKSCGYFSRQSRWTIYIRNGETYGVFYREQLVTVYR
jgi:hypothetical protein